MNINIAHSLKKASDKTKIAEKIQESKQENIEYVAYL